MNNPAAQALLEAEAIQLSTDPMFTWASGIKSPIYCDNRLLMGFPKLREQVAAELAQAIKSHYPECEAVAGTATAGIPHAAWVATELQLPMLYVRSKAKEHGRGNQIEGKMEPGQQVVVIEDLISTGGSSITAVEALQEAGFVVLGVISIFSYELPKATEAFEKVGVSFHSLTNLKELLETSRQQGILDDQQLEFIQNWHRELQQKNA